MSSSSIYYTNHFTRPRMIQVPTESHLRTYYSIQIMTTSQRHPNIRKSLCVLAIPKYKTNLLLKMTMTPKNLHKH